MLTKNFQQLQSKVVSHVEADKVAQGSYQSCFIGCLANQADDPEFIQSKYGIPLAVSRIAETIFEGLPAADAPLFFEAFPSAVGCDGKDLSRVHWQFLAAELRSLPAVPNGVQAAIDPVIAGMDLLASGLEWNEAQVSANAANAAYAAAYAAEDAADAAHAANAAYAAAYAANAAYAAAYAADAANAAANAAYAVADAAYAAYAADAAYAAYAAKHAAYAANAAKHAAYAADAEADWVVARADAFLRQRDLLLRLIKEAPVA